MDQQVSAYRILPPENFRRLKRLNLGCGRRRLEGFVNLDINPDVGAEVVRDLARGLPFEDDSIAEIRGLDLLEHIRQRDLIFILNECWRVLDPAGTAIFRSPNALSKTHPDWALGDPTHTQLWTPHRWHYWTHEHEQHLYPGALYGIKPWKIQITMIDGDATIQATMQPVKVAS